MESAWQPLQTGYLFPTNVTLGPLTIPPPYRIGVSNISIEFNPSREDEEDETGRRRER